MAEAPQQAKRQEPRVVALALAAAGAGGASCATGMGGSLIWSSGGHLTSGFVRTKAGSRKPWLDLTAICLHNLGIDPQVDAERGFGPFLLGLDRLRRGTRVSDATKLTTAGMT